MRLEGGKGACGLTMQRIDHGGKLLHSRLLWWCVSEKKSVQAPASLFIFKIDQVGALKLADLVYLLFTLPR